jgi:predicted NBD/HSP70 family sugar kinase
LSNNGQHKINGSQQVIKETNFKRIFSLIEKHEGISRAEIAAITGLSPTTVSSLAEEMVSKSMIFEAGPGELSTSGRKPILLKVNPGGGCIIAVDLQPDGFNLGCFDLTCRPIHEINIKTQDFKNLGELVCTETGQLVEKCGYKKENLLGICIGAPGIIDRSRHRIVSSTILPIDKNSRFYDEIIEKFPGIEVDLMNESSLSAYTEKEFNTELTGIENLLFIDVHEGIGAGIIINGKIYEGADSLAGEFGHISIDVNGPLCKCGSRGCLEVMANIPALVKDVETSHGKILVDDNSVGYDKRFSIIANGYKESGRFSNEVKTAANYIAYGINSAVNLMNPGAVVIGGKIKLMGSKFLEEVKSIIKRIGLYKDKEIKILLSQYNGNPVTAGGARHIFNKLFEVRE